MGGERRGVGGSKPTVKLIKKAKNALRKLYCTISEQQTNNPDGFFIIAGDFNQANLKTVLPKFYQHVNFATRGNNTLDFVYTTVKNAHKAEPRRHLGYSDHISVMLIPGYRPLLKLAKLVQKQIMVWPNNATSALQDCFQDTDCVLEAWKMSCPGNYLKRRPPTTTTQTCRSTLKLWLLTSRVHWWCDSYQDHHHTGKPEALDDSRGSWAAKDHRWSIQIRR